MFDTTLQCVLLIMLVKTVWRILEMSNIWEEYQQTQAKLQAEYAIVSVQWRFLQGVRAALVIGYLAMMAAFYAIYRAAWLSLSTNSSSEKYSVQVAVIESIIILATPIIALLTSHFAERTEEVLDRMINAASQRGQTIERHIGIRLGIFGDAGLGIAVLQPLASTLPQLIQRTFIVITVLLVIIFAGTLVLIVQNVRLR